MLRGYILGLGLGLGLDTHIYTFGSTLIIFLSRLFLNRRPAAPSDITWRRDKIKVIEAAYSISLMALGIVSLC